MSQRRFLSTPMRERLSSKRTRCPEESRRWARFEPTKPAPPVIKIGFDFPFLLPSRGVNAWMFLRRPLPFVGTALVFPLVIRKPPCNEHGGAHVCKYTYN